MNINRKAFTLVEVLVFSTILSLFFVSAASITTVTVQQAILNRKKIVATHYAEELLSMLQSERERGWDQLVSHATSENKEYCVNGDEIDWALLSCAPEYGLNGYNRTMILTPVGDPVSQVIIHIKVTWQEGANVFHVPLQTVFSLWEQ